MEIDTTKPVGDPTRGPEKTQPVDQTKREERETKGQASSQETLQTDETPGYRISLSDASRQALAELKSDRSSGQSDNEAGLSDDEASQISQKASVQLAQTNASISHNAIQKAIDLFT